MMWIHMYIIAPRQNYVCTCMHVCNNYKAREWFIQQYSDLDDENYPNV